MAGLSAKCLRLPMDSGTRPWDDSRSADEGCFPEGGGTCVREVEIRAAILKQLRQRHPDPTGTLIVEELGLCYGEARVDIATVNGKLAGFEIKSARDSLVRLPAQASLYGRVMDEMTLVCALRHLQGALTVVPDWWGIVVAETDGCFEEREASSNSAVDPISVLQLLWRGELLAAARTRAIPGISRTTRQQLVEALAAALSLEEVRALARDGLRSREGWRSPRTPR
jgi:hypothetical protein